jgi:hypothetical protein
MTRRRTVAGSLAVLTFLAVLSGCGSGGTGTPEGTLESLAEAVDDADDAAIAALVCAESREKGTGLAQLMSEAVQADPKLADFRYDATAGPVTRLTDDVAVGTLTVEAKGVPDDLSPAGRQFLDQPANVRPISLIGANNQLKLVLRDGTWLACED